MAVEEFKLDRLSKEAHVNPAPDENSEIEDDNVSRLGRRHTLSSSFRFPKKHLGKRLSFRHQHSVPSPGTSEQVAPDHERTVQYNIHRRRSLAGTFTWDPSLGLQRGYQGDGKEGEGSDRKDTDPFYDPYQERIVDYPTTNMETLLHLLKGSLGTGILAMPNAFYHSGWALGIAGTLIIGMICTYCIHLLITCEYELCRRRRLPALNYPATAEAALLEGPPFFAKMAPYAGHVINFFLLAYQLGICCVYVVFVASNIKDVADYYYAPLDLRLYMLMCLLPLILINYVRNLKYMAPFSSLANLITFIGFGITLYYVFDDLPSLKDRAPVGRPIDWPLFMGTVLFSLEAIGVIMPLENEMKTPQAFGGPCGVLNQAMVFIIFLYVGMGFFGFQKYGAAAKGSITLNIPTDEVLAQVVKITMALAIFITHALQCYVAIDITWTGYLAPRFEKSSHKLLIEYTIRTLLVLFTLVVGASIPYLELFIPLVGAFALSIAVFCFPSLIDLCTWWKKSTGINFVILITRDVSLCTFGFISMLIGTQTSVQNIIETFKRDGIVPNNVTVVLLAVAIPNLDLFISLIGALCLSALGIAFPAAIQQCTWWKQTEGRAFYMMTLKNIALVVFGIVGLIVGTYVSLKAIVEHFGDPAAHPS